LEAYRFRKSSVNPEGSRFSFVSGTTITHTGRVVDRSDSPRGELEPFVFEFSPLGNFFADIRLAFQMGWQDFLELSDVSVSLLLFYRADPTARTTFDRKTSMVLVFFGRVPSALQLFCLPHMDIGKL